MPISWVDHSVAVKSPTVITGRLGFADPRHRRQMGKQDQYHHHEYQEHHHRCGAKAMAAPCCSLSCSGYTQAYDGPRRRLLSVARFSPAVRTSKKRPRNCNRLYLTCATPIATRICLACATRTACRQQGGRQRACRRLLVQMQRRATEYGPKEAQAHRPSRIQAVPHSLQRTNSTMLSTVCGARSFVSQ